MADEQTVLQEEKVAGCVKCKGTGTVPYEKAGRKLRDTCPECGGRTGLRDVLTPEQKENIKDIWRKMLKEEGYRRHSVVVQRSECWLHNTVQKDEDWYVGLNTVWVE